MTLSGIGTEFEPAALLGRDPSGLETDYRDADPEIEAMVVAEQEAVRRLLEASTTLAPTAVRALAIELMAGPALLVDDVASALLLVEIARDWIDEMGDPVRFARNVQSQRAQGLDVLEAKVVIGMWKELDLVLDVYDAANLIAIMKRPGRPSVVVGVVQIDDDHGDDGDDVVSPTPELVA